jgi:hypothetical protein
LIQGAPPLVASCCRDACGRSAEPIC